MVNLTLVAMFFFLGGGRCSKAMGNFCYGSYENDP